MLSHPSSTERSKDGAPGTRREANWGYHLWGLVTLVLWMRRWKIEAPAMELATVDEKSRDVVADEALGWGIASTTGLYASQG